MRSAWSSRSWRPAPRASAVTAFAIDDDDRPIGRILTRRELLGLIGGTALVAACAPGSVGSPSGTTVATQASVAAATAATSASGAVVLPSCVVRPALTEGPYFVDANGTAKFTTIWPGWYQGRAVHIHFKIRATAANGQVSDFTSQLFFDEAMNDQIFAQAPYSQKGGAGRLRNQADGIFQGSGGKLTPAPAEAGDGYTATFDIGLTA